MHPFFPQLFYLSYFALILLQLASGGLLIYEAQQMWRDSKHKIYAGVSGVLGALLVVGLFTQAAALIAVFDVIYGYRNHKKDSVFASIFTVILAVAILAYLFISGPGTLAFDSHL